ncbi:MAG: DUF4837 family protein [Bacteroidales bacterium]|nr:DUF4837 family protein [Bacteroidales bacterium]
MKKKIFISLIIAFSFMLAGLSSCNSNILQNNTSKPNSIGTTAEVLVILQNDGQWSDSIGINIRKYFQASIYGLPQSEPTFKLLHIDKNNFNNLFQTQRDIFMVNIDPKVKDPKIEIQKDVWAFPQTVITLTAPSEQSFVDVFKDRHDLFIERFMKSERKVIQDIFRSAMNWKVMSRIQGEFGFTMIVPEGFYVAKEHPGFMWVRYESNYYSQGFIIISQPYVDTAQFSRESILTRIENNQMKFIPGPSEGSYMAIDRKFLIPEYTPIYDFPRPYAVKVDGLWKVEKDFMGGPFVSYTFTDPKSKNIITLFGYVYYPNHPKRDLMLQVESILYSVDYSGKPLKKAEKKH